MEPSVPLLLTPPPRPQSEFRIGRFAFSDDQLEYLLVCLKHAGGIYTTREFVLVFRYKWPHQFRFLLESDMELVKKWLVDNSQAKKCVDIKDARIVEGLVDDRTSLDGRSINDYTRPEPLDSEREWYQVFERQQYTSRSPEVTQIINTFRIELREAEMFDVLALAKRIGPEIVLVIRATKIRSDLSSLDIACGLTNRYSKFVRGYRYVWMCPFTEMHVETIWYRSQLAKNESFKYLARGIAIGQLPTLTDLIEAFKKDVGAGGADKALRLDPRSSGDETSAVNFAAEVVRQFLSCVAGKAILETAITEPVMHS